MSDETPQLEDGYTRIANELLDAIIAFPFSARQMRVLMGLIRKLYGYNKKRDDISASQIGELCAMHRSHVSETLGHLTAMKVIFKEPGRFGNMIEINKNYRQWLELDSKGEPKERAARNKVEYAFHYTYRTTKVETGEFYLGVRSCACHPNQDRYIGSGNWIATVKAAELRKEVVATYASRQEAEQAEKDLIRSSWGNPLLRNTTLYESTELVQGVQNLYRGTEAEQGVQNQTDASTGSVHLASTESVHTKDNLPKDIEQKTEIFPRSLRDRFEIFWKQYPRKTEKQDALKAFEKLNPDDDLLRTILAGLSLAKRSEQWQKKQFIKHAATWLNKACWQDEWTVAYTQEQLAVMAVYNEHLGDTLGLANGEVFVGDRADAIDDFLNFVPKDPAFWQRYFPWVAANVDVPPHCGFDWLIGRDGFTKVKGGQHTKKDAA